MPKTEKSKEEQIKDAIKEVQDAMLENIANNKLIIDIEKKKKASHYKLQKAREFLHNLELECMEL